MEKAEPTAFDPTGAREVAGLISGCVCMELADPPSWTGGRIILALRD